MSLHNLTSQFDNLASYVTASKEGRLTNVQRLSIKSGLLCKCVSRFVFKQGRVWPEFLKLNIWTTPKEGKREAIHQIEQT
jgi:hypothetical protein